MGSGSAVGRLSRTTCGIVSSIKVALQASEETSGEYRVDFEYANATAGNPVGTCLLGNYDASSVLTTTQDEQDFGYFF